MEHDDDTQPPSSLVAHGLTEGSNPIIIIACFVCSPPTEKMHILLHRERTDGSSLGSSLVHGYPWEPIRNRGK